MAAAARLLLVACLCGSAAAMNILKPGRHRAPQNAKALLVTMVFPDDQVPVDLMLEHQMRMIAGNQSSVEAAIIDNRPPWMGHSSNHDSLLARFQRSQGSTGKVTVKDVDYTKLSVLMERFFGSSAIQLASKTVNLASDIPANVSKLDGKAKAARLLGMLHFLELCSDADSEVDLCIYMDPTTFVYRDGDKGIVEQAKKLFQQEPTAVVMVPQDMCASAKAYEKGVCRVANGTATLNHAFFVMSRDRFDGFAPMKVEDVDLTSSFEEILEQGLTKGGVENAVKKMRCGGAFGIHPYDHSLGKYSCMKGQQAMGLPLHVNAIGSGRMPEGHFDADYLRFPGNANRAKSLQAMIDRFEEGKFPEPKYLESVTNKCFNMCPSLERITEGLAW